MVDISIDVLPDPVRDAQARRGALALLTGMVYDPEGDGPKDLSSAALQDLVEQVLVDIGEVREESAAALQLILSAVARQYTAFAAVASYTAVEAYEAGRRARGDGELDLPEVLAGVRQALDQDGPLPG